MMGTQMNKLGNDEHNHGGVIQSSIALLQERFKQVQRVKEMREKRDLRRIFSQHNDDNNNNIHNNNNNSTTSTTTTILSTSTVDTTTATTNNNNNNGIPSKDSAMQNNNEPYAHDNSVDDDDKEMLQVFLPPNYYNYNKPSCYSSPSSLSSLSSSPSPRTTASPSTSSSSISCDNHSETSLSLWPSTPPCNININAASLFLPTTSNNYKEMISRPSCISSRVFKFEDSPHHRVSSDVDTTLHL